MKTLKKSPYKIYKMLPKCRCPVKDALFIVDVLPGGRGRCIEMLTSYFIWIREGYSCLSKLTRQEALRRANDIAQTVVVNLIELLLVRGKLKQVRCVRAYVRKMLRNKTSDLDKKLGREILIGSIAHRSIEERINETGRTTDSLQNEGVQEGQFRIRSALTHLTAFRRVLLYLQYYRKFTYEQMAKMLSTTPGSVGATLTYARGQLRSVLKTQTQESF